MPRRSSPRSRAPTTTGRCDMTAAQTIARFASSITLEDVPAEVVEHAKLHVLDTLGCGLAAHATGNGSEGRETMRELGGEPQATGIGLAPALPAAHAALP